MPLTGCMASNSADHATDPSDGHVGDLVPIDRHAHRHAIRSSAWYANEARARPVDIDGAPELGFACARTGRELWQCGVASASAGLYKAGPQWKGLCRESKLSRRRFP